MSFIWEKSPAWRRMVVRTRESRLAMLGFTACCFGIPCVLGLLTMGFTNPTDSTAREKLLRQRSGLDGQVLARVNKERLGVLLAEVHDKRPGEERWREALDGRTLGTSSGSSAGVHRGVEPRSSRDSK